MIKKIKKQTHKKLDTEVQFLLNKFKEKDLELENLKKAIKKSITTNLLPPLKQKYKEIIKIYNKLSENENSNKIEFNSVEFNLFYDCYDINDINDNLKELNKDLYRVNLHLSKFLFKINCYYNNKIINLSEKFPKEWLSMDLEKFRTLIGQSLKIDKPSKMMTNIKSKVSKKEWNWLKNNISY